MTCQSLPWSERTQAVFQEEVQRWAEEPPACPPQGKFLMPASAETMRQRALAGGLPNQPSSCASKIFKFSVFDSQRWSFTNHSVFDSQRLSSAAMADPSLQGVPERMLLDDVRSKECGQWQLKTGSSEKLETRAGRRWNQQVVDKAQGSRLPKIYKYKQIQTNKYKQIQTNTNEYKRIQTNTKKQTDTR